MITRLWSGNLVLDLETFSLLLLPFVGPWAGHVTSLSFRFLPFLEVRWVKLVFFFFLKKLEYNCFAIFCSFLLYNIVSQLYVCMNPLTHEPCSRPAYPTPSVITGPWPELPVLLSSLPLAACFTLDSAYVSVLPSQFTPPSSSPPCDLMSAFYTCISTPSLQRGSSVTFFQIPCIYIIIW